MFKSSLELSISETSRVKLYAISSSIEGREENDSRFVNVSICERQSVAPHL